MRRYFAALLAAALLFGCVPGEANVLEHAEPAMAYCLAAALYYPDTEGGVTRVERTFPWEFEMEAGVLNALKVAPEDDLLAALPDSAVYSVQVSDGCAAVDLSGMPPFSDVETERRCVQCVVNTMLSLPHVQSVQLTFDGTRVAALKNGTEVYEPFEEQLP